jgi:hypothetical protein
MFPVNKYHATYSTVSTDVSELLSVINPTQNHRNKNGNLLPSSSSNNNNNNNNNTTAILYTLLLT